MLVIPAIDLKDGRCVRLRQGRMSEETIFSDFPHEVAKRWYDMGAERIHVVDLNGAHQGTPVNGKVIKKMVDAVPIPIQLGGGIRDMETLEAYLEQGIRWVILGTVACKDPEFVFKASERYPGRVILGIDARRGRVAVQGWTEEVALDPVDMVKMFEGAKIAAIVYTDILRDGMRTGPNIQATAELARSTSIPVIASGGVSGIGDVKALLRLRPYGVMGMITGRALYDGALDLKGAIALCKGGLSGQGGG
ncbi:MAG: 1-(5-phosphoribosyl)-5-[(5-phosphoribosylamino)methylideneamino]imidazole-4-carboxamide isomerase [Deltaproteobacteria bacterium]|nr:1-(5-phosphoribosyl)-5-[(5-phosphoribosylamino)methylideneamino]imidazole-4-carboxamide isomerase [Deltaproteobacteria bacterium]MBW1928949.1 1-(5-phosphoribosyl)-5-[(5-phosphoribosylamino)methylideneamino]imidazole-4-carboxamide isomerase [Deltaproteobacteria bacterium]MBW2024492.1 1-(5-phosphoribosyl)-5-[(5-phosphoribosylamino)methylideneamino]imidazole-4-carboxamide isomerase [Deltaproteobacteria bacterium]MBW2125131.1 1-(5-phosphoribosyl)-5-[(5-phosphoribosylamino)methylideneamino]imidazo